MALELEQRRVSKGVNCRAAPQGMGGKRETATSVEQVSLTPQPIPLCAPVRYYAHQARLGPDACNGSSARLLGSNSGVVSGAPSEGRCGSDQPPQRTRRQAASHSTSVCSSSTLLRCTEQATPTPNTRMQPDAASRPQDQSHCET